MTYVLGPCPVKGCAKKHGVTVVRRSRPALIREAAGAATAGSSELPEAVGLHVPAVAPRAASVGSHQPSTSMPGHLRGPREPFTGPFISPIRLSAESLQLFPPAESASADMPRGMSGRPRG